MALLPDMFSSCCESRAAEKQALKFWSALDGTVLSGHANINQNTSPWPWSRPLASWFGLQGKNPQRLPLKLSSQ